MELFETIAKRQSYRGAFQDKVVKHNDLQLIVEAGLKAPSGKNAQTTVFVIVGNEKILQKIRDMHLHNKAMQQCKALIACIVDVEPEPVYQGLSFMVEDCAAAVENMLLAVTALGYATVWIDGWLRAKSRAEAIGALLEVPEGKIVRVILPVGIPTEDYPGPDKKPFKERAWFNRYGRAE